MIPKMVNLNDVYGQNGRFEFASMTIDDLPQVMALERLSYSFPWPESAFRQELRNDKAYFTTLRYRTRLIGYVGLWHLVDQAHIGTIVSHPQLRRKGLGQLLLVQAIDQARRLQADSVTLEVRPSNLIARRLYTKYGFEMVGKRRRYYPDTGEDAIIMTTPLMQNEYFADRLANLVLRLTEQLQGFDLA